MRIVTAAALVVFLSASAHTQPAEPNISTGNGLYETCTTESSDVMRLVCSAYIRGIADVGIGMRFFCPPAGVNYGQMQDVVIASLRAKPEVRHMRSDMLILGALLAAFRCPPKPSS